MGCLIPIWLVLGTILLAQWNIGTLVFTVPVLFFLATLTFYISDS